MFTNTYAPMVGGLERSVAHAHEDLNRAGHHSTVITPAFSGATVSADGVLRLPALRNLGRKRFSLPLPAPWLIDRWISSASPQVIHAHQPFLLGDAALRFARKKDVPLVFTHHTFYERYSHYLPLEPATARRWVIRFTTRYANRCTLVIAPTASVRNILLERGVKAPIEVAPTGINIEMYSNPDRAAARKHYRFSRTDEVVGHLGRLGREKNLDYLLEAMLRLMSARPSVRWLLIGAGDRLPRVRERLQAAGLLHRLIAPGVLEGADAARAYAAMDVFAFTSRSDTQGLVLAESMASGVPVVALDAPGTQDCVNNRINGVLVRAEAAPEEFTEALLSLLAEPARRTSLAEAAQRDAARFARPRCLARLLDVYGHAVEAYRRQKSVAAITTLEASRT
jgi:1,2-diacylglycerol 3-alpha-glucosyltransferase